jgi:uncharacterized protein (DUF1697 family)
MPTYIALLRGVNVGGNILKMDRLRELCAALGARNVRTYVQSGNLVFEASESASHWEMKLEKKLDGECRLPVSVMVRTAAEMETVRANNPFLKEKGIDMARLGVVFLQRPPAKHAIAALAALDIRDERFHHARREVYIHCPDGFGNARLYLLDKILQQRTTTRNWNTINKLREMFAK